MRFRYVVPLSILVLFISLMPSVSHALTLQITDANNSGLILYTSGTITGTSGSISLAGVGNVQGLTVGTCAGCTGDARVSFLDGPTVDKIWVRSLALTPTNTDRLTGVTLNFYHTFSAVNSSPYPVGPALTENFVNGTNPNNSSATLTQEVFSAGCIECSANSSRTVTDAAGGVTNFSGTNQGSVSLTPGFIPSIVGTYRVTFNALNNTVRIPNTIQLILAKGISYEEALLIEEDGSSASVPEPSSLLLLGTGLLVAVWGLSRKRLVA